MCYFRGKNDGEKDLTCLTLDKITFWKVKKRVERKFQASESSFTWPCDVLKKTPIISAAGFQEKPYRIAQSHRQPV